MLEKTRLRPSWRNRTLIIAIVLLGFGAWGAYDASVAYPARGRKVAEKLEYNYLVAAKHGDENASLRAADVSVPEPAKALARLKERVVSQDPPLSEFESSRLRWLDALPVVGMLDESHTTYTDSTAATPDEPRDPNTRFDELDATWAGVSPPKPLHSYDLLFQWIIFAVCWTLGMLALGTMALTSFKKFAFDSQSHTLTLPTGQSLTPDDLAEIDKRKWHKFFVFLTVSAEHPALAGRTLKIDLFRRDRLEGWILEMEKIAFPDRASDEARADQPADSPPDASSTQDQADTPADQ